MIKVFLVGEIRCFELYVFLLIFLVIFRFMFFFLYLLIFFFMIDDDDDDIFIKINFLRSILWINFFFGIFFGVY